MPEITRLPIGQYAYFPPKYGNKEGIVLEISEGVLLCATSSPFVIFKSSDNGATWTAKHTEAHPNRNARLNFITSGGTIFYGTALTNSTSFLMRSDDDGETWTNVLTVDSDSMWYMIERDNGDLYLNEYNSSNTLKFAYRVMKSTDDGVNWAEFYAHQPGPDPSDGNNRTIRHLHMIARDSDDTMYLTMAHGTDVGTYVLNDDGTLGTMLDGETTGGATAFVQADNGDIFWGTDNFPCSIYKTNDDGDGLEEVINMQTVFGDDRSTFCLGMSKGRFGVLYALTNGANPDKIPYLFASPDDGVTWVLMPIARGLSRPTFVNIGLGTTPRIYIDQATDDEYIILPDFTKEQLLYLSEA
jgi:hypothetical protein